ncbi:hypothetical protein BACI349Y_430060 [Bacillus sp. 349Y]|nr:hypothetical protein BACI349Y_430060 [Bacillus sp. 349Y]
MSFGLPIVSFQNKGPNEILDSGKYGILIENGDVNSFIYEINKLINNSQQIKS